MEPATTWRIPVMALLLLQCNDKDPTVTTTTGFVTEGPAETDPGPAPTTGGEGCGDGAVAPGEICDGQPGCDADCLGPPVCTPFHNIGCMPGKTCEVVDGVAACIDPGVPEAEGKECGVLYDQYPDDTGYYYDTDTEGYEEVLHCAGGLVCWQYGCDFAGPNGCCVRPCVIGGEPCPDPLEECESLAFPAPLNYLGVCFVPT